MLASDISDCRDIIRLCLPWVKLLNAANLVPIIITTQIGNLLFKK